MRIKLLFLLALIALLVVSVTGNFHQWRNRKADKARIALLQQSVATPQNAIVARAINPTTGIEHVTVAPLPARSTTQKVQAIGAGYIDTVTRALQVAVKQLDEASRIVATLEAKNLKLEAAAAVAGQAPGKPSYSDKWLNLTYNPDSNSVDLSYNVTLNSTRYWKRSWLLGNRRYYTDIFSEDPRVRINSVQAFTVPEPRPKRFGLGLQVGGGYLVQTANPFTNPFVNPIVGPPNLYIGAGLSYNLIRF